MDRVKYIKPNESITEHADTQFSEIQFFADGILSEVQVSKQRRTFEKGY